MLCLRLGGDSGQSAARDPGGDGEQPSGSADGCDPNYAGACLRPNSPDYDCAGGSGDGPDYTGQVEVIGDDHYGLDRDGDGIGCDHSTSSPSDPLTDNPPATPSRFVNRVSGGTHHGGFWIR